MRIQKRTSYYFGVGDGLAPWESPPPKTSLFD